MPTPPTPAPLILAVVNKKGGVGKTTTTINLAGGFHHLYDQTVTILDLDSQGNSTKALTTQTDHGEQMARAFETAMHEEPEAILPRPTATHIRLVPGGSALARAERLDGLAASRLMAIVERTDFGPQAGDPPSKGNVVLIDTPPNFGVLTMSALLAAHYVVIVTEPEPMSIDGIQQCVATIREARQFNRQLELLGIIPNKVRNRVVDRENLALLRQGQWEKFVTQNHVRQNVSLVEPYYSMQTIFDYAPGSHGAKDYGAITHELWEKIHG